MVSHHPGSMGTRCDIAIVGAGPGGLYAAWRLRAAFPEAVIHLYDALATCGGRVRSIRSTALGYVADIGAMRYLSTQVLINGLVKQFGDLQSYPHGSPIASYFLRGVHLLPDPQDGAVRRVTGIAQTHYRLGGSTEVTPQDRYQIDDTEKDLPIGGVLQFGIAQVLARVRIYREGHRKSVVAQEVQPDALEEQLNGLRMGVNWRTLSFRSFSVQQWLAIKQFGLYDGNKHLYNCGLWELLSDVLSPEAFAMARDSLGYDTIFGACNAAEHIPWFLAEFQGVSYSSIRGGMSKLIEKLEPASGVFRKHTLRRVSTCDQLLRLEFVCGNTKVEVAAGKVILAISKGALSSIDFNGLELRSELASVTRLRDLAQPEQGSEVVTRFSSLREALDCITAHPLRKAFAFWDAPWFWSMLSLEDQVKLIRSSRCAVGGDASAITAPATYDPSLAPLARRLELVSARIQTDLPVRQLFMYGPAADSPWRTSADGLGGMMMVYFDASESEYFALLAGRNRGDLSPESAPGSSVDTDVRRALERNGEWKDIVHFTVNEEFTKAMRRSLGRVFKEVLRGGEVPRPRAVLFQDWSDAPYYGGWHSWKITFKPWEMRELLRRPFSTNNVMVCGEAISADQGWIEGALRTCEAGLVQVFGLEPVQLPGMREGLVAARFLPEASEINQEDVDKAFQDYLRW
jgi:hypothetical protein